jgi:YbbR domain-containing protein
MTEKIKRLGSFFPGFISNDFPRKLIALFFALLVYFTVNYKIGDEGKIQGVPVKINIPNSLVSMEEGAPKVTLDVRASSRNLKKLTSASFSVRVYVNESKYVSNEPYPVKITPQDVNAPLGVKVVKVEPDEILLTLDRNISRKVPVKAKLERTSKLPEGYTAGEVKLTPEEITITGPGRQVDKIKSMFTEPIPLDKTTTESFDFFIPLAVTSSVIKMNPPKVMAQVEIVREEEKKLFRSVPLKILESSSEKNLKAELITTPHVDINVVGSKTKLKLMKASQLKAYLDISSFDKPGVYNVDVGCWTLVENVKVDSIYPPQVQVKLTQIEAEKEEAKASVKK